MGDFNIFSWFFDLFAAGEIETQGILFTDLLLLPGCVRKLIFAICPWKSVFRILRKLHICAADEFAEWREDVLCHWLALCNKICLL